MLYIRQLEKQPVIMSSWLSCHCGVCCSDCPSKLQSFIICTSSLFQASKSLLTSEATSCQQNSTIHKRHPATTKPFEPQQWSQIPVWTAPAAPKLTRRGTQPLIQRLHKVCTKMQTTQQANAYWKMTVNKCIRILAKMFFKFLGAQLTNKLWTRFPPDSHLHRRKNLLHLTSHASNCSAKDTVAT